MTRVELPHLRSEWIYSAYKCSVLRSNYERQLLPNKRNENIKHILSNEIQAIWALMQIS